MSLDKTNWELVKLGGVVSHSKEAVDPSSGEISRYVAGEHMETDSLKISNWGEVGDGYLGPAFIRRFHPGQILYGSRRTYLRKLAVADFDGVCSNTTLVLSTTDPGRLLQEFLPLAMTTEKFHSYSIRESKGSVNPYVNWSDLAKYEFALPPLDQQKEIANVFWLMEKNLRALEDLARKQHDLEVSLLSKLFDDYQGNFKKLAEIATLERGASYKTSDYSEDETGIPFLTLKSVSRDATYSAGGLKWVKKDFSAASIAKTNDLFIANTDLTPGRLLVGAPFYFPGVGSQHNPIYSMDLSKISSSHEYLSNEYIYLALKTLRARKYMVMNTRGSTVGHLDIKSVLKFEVPEFSLPEWNLVREKTTVLLKTLESIRSEKSALQLLSVQLKNRILDPKNEL
jgi:type I restriction enzyme S subunit